MPILRSNFGLNKDAIPPKNKNANNAAPIWNFEYPSAFHKNGNKIEQEVVIKDFKIAIIFKILSFWFVKISVKACFKFISTLLDFSSENFGTKANIKHAQTTPKTARICILFNPKYCAVNADNNGPNEKPRVPIAINIPIFFAELDVVNFETNPNDWGW